MNNVLLDALPTEYEGERGKTYPLNTWYQVGIQILLIQDDTALADFEKTRLCIELLFDRDGILMEHPQGNELAKCIKWFLNGWYHDGNVKSDDKRKLIDYDIDQWRIFSDFWQIYHINLNESDMHWWQFCGMLWNMPDRTSSFHQVLSIRRKKVKAKMGKEEKDAIRAAQHQYGLGEKQVEKLYTEKEKSKIDDFDQMMEEIRKKKSQEKDIIKAFEKR